MPLGNRAAVCVLRNGQHVAVKIERNAAARKQRVQFGDHRAVAVVAFFAPRREEIVNLLDAGVRHGVQEDVRVARLVGVVDADGLERRARHAHAALDAVGAAQAKHAAGLEELAVAAQAVMIDDAGGTQPLGARAPGRGRGRIGREGERGVDVVVDVILHRGERGIQAAKVCQPLCGCGGVEQGQNFVH